MWEDRRRKFESEWTGEAKVWNSVAVYDNYLKVRKGVNGLLYPSPTICASVTPKRGIIDVLICDGLTHTWAAYRWNLEKIGV